MSCQPVLSSYASSSGQDPIMLGLVALQAPVRVVQVLPAAGVVSADGLDVAVGRWTDPYLLPCRRDDQLLATLHVLGRERLSELVQVEEAFSGAPPRPAGISGGDGTQSRHGTFLPELRKVTGSE